MRAIVRCPTPEREKDAEKQWKKANTKSINPFGADGKKKFLVLNVKLNVKDIKNTF